MQIERVMQTAISAFNVSVTLICACVFVSCARQPRLYLISTDSQPSNSAVSSAVNAQEASTNDSIININTASAMELEKLPGIGAKLAAEIVNHRARYGRFRRVEHLLLVRGISESRLRQMRSLISVE